MLQTGGSSVPPAVSGLLVDRPVTHRWCWVDFGLGFLGFVGLFGPTFWF